MNILDNIKAEGKHQVPFKTPENYFEQFESQMMAQLPEKEISTAPSISMWKRIKPIVYLAAMFAAAIWGINLFAPQKQHVNRPEMAMVTDKESESVAMAMTVDDYSLYEYMNDNTDLNNH